MTHFKLLDEISKLAKNESTLVWFETPDFSYSEAVAVVPSSMYLDLLPIFERRAGELGMVVTESEID